MHQSTVLVVSRCQGEVVYSLDPLTKFMLSVSGLSYKLSGEGQNVEQKGRKGSL